MKKRRIVPLLLIVIISFGCSIYLENKYNSKVIEYSYNGAIDRYTIEKFDDYFGNRGYNVNLKTKYTGYNLIASTGKDMNIENVKLERGSFLIEPYGNFTVIGDKVADGYFSSIDVIGKSIMINGSNYKIKGVIRNSSDIYIPFNKGIDNIYWNRKIIRIVPEENENLDFSYDDIDSFLKSIGISITDTIIYEAKIKAYTNLSILILIYLACFLVIPQIQRNRLNIIGLWRGYLCKRRKIEWRNYIKEKRKDILNNLGHLLVNLLIILLIYKLIRSLYIPSYMIPTNLFAPSSYIQIIKGCYSSFMLHLENGFSSISIDMIKLDIMMVAIYLLAIYSHSLKERNKFFTIPF